MSRIAFATLSFATCLLAAAWSMAQETAAQDADKPVELKVGDEAPKFEAKDDADEDWKSEDHVGEKILVVYFYPADTTGGCTAQACGYRDKLAEFEEEGVEVIGVSGDTVESHQLFKKIENLNFTLLSDYDGAVAKAFGVKTAPGGTVKWNNPESGETIDLVRGVTTMRWTFVIDLDGKIAYKNDDVNAAKDPAEVAKVIAKLRKPA
jgi:peroxiredoxin Q/BCP